MGRPKKQNAKTRQFRIRMTDEDFRILEVTAKEAGATKTQVMMEGFYGLLRRLDHSFIDTIITEYQKEN